MKLNFCLRGNGACPLCSKEESCEYQQKMALAMKDIIDRSEHGMEIVIYSCPFFLERL